MGFFISYPQNLFSQATKGLAWVILLRGSNFKAKQQVDAGWGREGGMGVEDSYALELFLGL